MTPKLTKNGKNLLLEALNGEPIKFTKMQLGNGAPQEASDATALNNPLVTLNFTSCTLGVDYATLTADFNNQQITDGFRVTEVGFFAENPNDGASEILYAIGNEPESSADFIPSNDNRIIEMQLDGLLFIGDAENVTAAISSSLVYASQQELKDHTENTANPHKITKDQVGLGNVPNLATNDLMPTYTESETLESLKSGEKLSIVLGKVKTAIANFISHISNSSNPHKVTATQIGAAITTHMHSATDINAGTLSPTRGGTGVNSIEALASNISDRLVITKSYKGTGSTTNTIVFDGVRGYPKMLFIQPEIHSSDNDRAYAGLAVIGRTISTICGGFGATSGEADSIAGPMLLSIVYFDWYYGDVEGTKVCVDISGITAGYVQNMENVTYRVVAIF